MKLDTALILARSIPYHHISVIWYLQTPQILVR
uniref:Uncharacterized protein n=1 Tax=Arundo donax TaxID=35708 RepID=A0A0A8YR33_ARUDO